jgi:hypothetical protein
MMSGAEMMGGMWTVGLVWLLVVLVLILGIAALIKYLRS